MKPHQHRRDYLLGALLLAHGVAFIICMAYAHVDPSPRFIAAGFYCMHRMFSLANSTPLLIFDEWPNA